MTKTYEVIIEQISNDALPVSEKKLRHIHKGENALSVLMDYIGNRQIIKHHVNNLGSLNSYVVFIAFNGHNYIYRATEMKNVNLR